METITSKNINIAGYELQAKVVRVAEGSYAAQLIYMGQIFDTSIAVNNVPKAHRFMKIMVETYRQAIKQKNNLGLWAISYLEGIKKSNEKSCS